LAAGNYTIKFTPSWSSTGVDVKDYTISVYALEQTTIYDSNGKNVYNPNLATSSNNATVVVPNRTVTTNTTTNTTNPVTPVVPVPVTPTPVVVPVTPASANLTADLTKAISTISTNGNNTYTNGGWYFINKGYYTSNEYYF